ncbi:L-idonate 5-dehydrogenase [Georgenia yuyongxinii]|uniref:L-idonate 5-dehydrogenase n=1 Tax=Georgenia yuyongxinii TaxID=2589797 RepID=A0A552WQA8_9MICO|nr:L-idonate 5-dehydrogenase [Georgenia yuyongxinii]TRW44799.1 L-idonate 5-dehydrogenase [Georgenia yuyongxinii]
MKAVVVHGAGDLRVEDIPEPQCGPDEVLVEMEFGGICGSDLAYWRHGASGTAVLREPLVLGHEVAGRIAQVGANVRGLVTGTPVTVHPATNVGDGVMPERLAGRTNLYHTVRYFGSAAFVPHEQGGFCQYRVVRPDQIRVLPTNVTTRQAAVAEPLAVALHAVNRAGDLTGKTVLVNGCGPIGVLTVAAAKARGAAEVIGADLAPASLEIARRMGADRVVNPAAGEDLPQDVDVSFEASGAPAALGGVIAATARGGVLVQVGNLPVGDVSASLGNIVTREIEYRGSYRFADEISDALTLLSEGLDVEPLLTHTFLLADALAAFETAGDRSTGSSKVLLQIGE